MPIVTQPASVPHFGDLEPWVALTRYFVGQRVTNSGNVYQCTVEGTSGAGPGPAGGGGVEGSVTWVFQSAISSPWAPGTPYTAGDVVTNDGGKLYIALVTGVSGAGGGPTGTGGAIVEGTMAWSFEASVNAAQTQPTSRTGDAGLVTGGPLFAPYGNWWTAAVTAWILYLRGLGQAIIVWLYGIVSQERQPGDPSPDTPQLKTQDSAGRLNGGIDHLGFPSARPILRLHEDWLFHFTDFGYFAPAWTGSKWSVQGSQAGGGAQIAVNNPVVSGGGHVQYIRVVPNDANNDNIGIMLGQNIAGSGALFFPDGNLEFRAEWCALITADDNTAWYMGLASTNEVNDVFNHDVGHINKIAFVHYVGQDWDGNVDNGVAGVFNDLFVAPTANVWQRFALEYHGNTTPRGIAAGGACVRFFVNDVQAGTDFTVDVPTGTPMRLGFAGIRKAGALASELHVGPVDVYGHTTHMA